MHSQTTGQVGVGAIQSIVDQALDLRRDVRDRAVLIALTGIDGCGKGYLTGLLVQALQHSGVRPAPINIDGWLNLPHIRFGGRDPAEHFYRHAIRFDECFSQLVFPLRDHRQIRLEANYTEETASSYRQHRYESYDIDVVVLEGIYLLKRELQGHYDLAVWIECTFETALRRALARAQEGLSPAETVEAYQTIYFPAQEIHLLRDDPRGAADLIVTNDPLLSDGRWCGTSRVPVELHPRRATHADGKQSI